MTCDIKWRLGLPEKLDSSTCEEFEVMFLISIEASP